MEDINKKLDTIIKLLEKLAYPHITTQQPPIYLTQYQCPTCGVLFSGNYPHCCFGNSPTCSVDVDKS